MIFTNFSNGNMDISKKELHCISCIYLIRNYLLCDLFFKLIYCIQVFFDSCIFRLVLNSPRHSWCNQFATVLSRVTSRASCKIFRSIDILNLFEQFISFDIANFNENAFHFFSSYIPQWIIWNLILRLSVHW